MLRKVDAQLLLDGSVRDLGAANGCVGLEALASELGVRLARELVDAHLARLVSRLELRLEMPLVALDAVGDGPSAGELALERLNALSRGREAVLEALAVELGVVLGLLLLMDDVRASSVRKGWERRKGRTR